MPTILVVDDSATDQLEIVKILERNQFSVIKASDGKEAVATAKSALPDLIIMDVVMPSLNGFQATRQICKNAATSHIPVILVSGKSQETDRQWGMRQGAKDYLVKPTEESLLITSINNLLPE
jgi:twitching motility two-component system response regulator PilH